MLFTASPLGERRADLQGGNYRLHDLRVTKDAEWKHGDGHIQQQRAK